MPRSVAGQQRPPGRGGVGGDVEIRQRRAASAATAAVLQEAAAGQERGLPRQVLAFDAAGQRFLEVFDALEPQGQFALA